MLESLKNAFGGKGKQTAMPPFSGSLEQLAMAIDLGTSFSAVTLIHMMPGLPPVLHEVRFGPSTKSPPKTASRMWYHAGRPVAFGSSCMEPEVRSRARREGWEEAVAFKLHLHPDIIAPPKYTQIGTRAKSTPASATVLPQGVFDIAPLPAGVDINQCLTDWFRWLMDQTRLSFCRSREDGSLIWHRLGHNIAYVVTHPNGWAKRERDIVEQALEAAGYFDAWMGTEDAPSTDDDKKGKKKSDKDQKRAEKPQPSSSPVATSSQPPTAAADPDALPLYNPEASTVHEEPSVPPPTVDFEKGDRRNRLRWLSEAEASLNYLIHATPASKLATLWDGPTWSNGTGFVGRLRNVVVVDAGGSTVDVQQYRLKWGGVKLRLSTKEDWRAAECVQAGAVFPTHFFRLFISKRLSGTVFGTSASIDRMVDAFDRDIKPRFEQTAAETWALSCDLPTSANDPALGIKSGKLILTTAEVASFFDPALRNVGAAVRSKFNFDREVAAYSRHHVFLTGGFGNSPQLRAQINKILQTAERAIFLSLPPTESKPVATGAAVWYTTYWLKSIRCDVSFGIPVYRGYLDGQRGARRCKRLFDGCNWYEGGYRLIAREGDYLYTGDRSSARFDFDSHEQGGVASIQLIVSTVPLVQPAFIDGYTTDWHGRPVPGQEVLYTFGAKLGPGDKWEKRRPLPKMEYETYWHKDMFLVIENTGESFDAYLEWSAEGGTKKSPPQRIPDRFLAGDPRDT